MSLKFENLIAWQKSKELAITIYSATDNYPREELYAITSQTNRAVISIMSNIAEGSSRRSNKDFYRFIEIAIGSAFELESLLIVAHERKYIASKEKERLDKIISEVEKLLNGLMRKLK